MTKMSAAVLNEAKSALWPGPGRACLIAACGSVFGPGQGVRLIAGSGSVRC